MKKRVLVAVVMLAALGAVSCGFWKYSDVKAHINEMIEYQYRYIEKLEKAEKGEDVARALNEYIDTMIRFSTDWQKLTEKYPELKKDEVPDALKGYFKKLNETIFIVRSRVEGPLNRYSLHPEVLKAHKRYTEKILQLGNDSADK